MAFTPDSVVYLLDTPLDNSYKNQIYFSSVSSQHTYFNSRVKHSYSDLSYVRKENMIRIPEHIDKLWDSNYIMYRNVDFGTKWFYGFITKMEYVSDKNTAVFIETDVYQTWLSETTLKNSFVIREHVMDDAKGKNLVDEGLEFGEYKLKTYVGTNKINEMAFVLAVTLDSDDPDAYNMYGNIYSGLTYYAYSESSLGAMVDTIESLVSAGKGDAIQFIFTMPKAFLPSTSGSLPNNASVNTVTWSYDGSLDNLDGYVPKNNKMFNYPYNLFYVSNNQGGGSEYRFEDFGQLRPTFSLMSCISPNPNVMMCPTNYKGQNTRVQEYGLSMSGYPLCSWSNDLYSAWLAQNSASMGLAVATSALQIGAGALSGNPVMMASGVSSGASIVANQMTQMYQHSIQPPQSKGNTNGGTLFTANNIQDFFTSHVTIKSEYANRIDAYFTMYGYKINAVKTPNISGRPTWNYVQTGDVNIVGGIPADDMRRLKQMFNDGVTFWKSGSNVGNYSLNNSL